MLAVSVALLLSVEQNLKHKQMGIFLDFRRYFLNFISEVNAQKYSRQYAYGAIDLISK